VSGASVWSEACEAVVERLQPPHPSSIRHRYALERVIKWKLLVSLLFLRKPPYEGPSRAASINPVVRHRFDMYEQGDLCGLIRDYEHDDVLGGNVPRGASKSKEDEDFEKPRAASEFLLHSQYSRARRHLQFFGFGEHTDTDIIRQMETKHPKRKEPIKPLTEEQLGAARKGLDRKRFMEVLG
jgi:hypothetical protein